MKKYTSFLLALLVLLVACETPDWGHMPTMQVIDAVWHALNGGQ